MKGLELCEFHSGSVANGALRQRRGDKGNQSWDACTKKQMTTASRFGGFNAVPAGICSGGDHDSLERAAAWALHRGGFGKPFVVTKEPGQALKLVTDGLPELGLGDFPLPNK